MRRALVVTLSVSVLLTLSLLFHMFHISKNDTRNDTRFIVDTCRDAAIRAARLDGAVLPFVQAGTVIDLFAITANICRGTWHLDHATSGMIPHYDTMTLNTRFGQIRFTIRQTQ